MIWPRIIKLFFCHILFIFFNSIGYCQTATLSTSFRIRHTSTSRYFVARKYIHTRNNETVIAGKHGTTENGADLLIMRLGQSGEVIWSKKIVVGIQVDEYELTEMSDGSIVLVANSWYNSAPTNSDMLLIKFSCKGDIVWSKNLSMTASVKKRFMVPYSIREGKNNDAIISFYGGETNERYTVICRVNNSGNIVWSKTFYGIDPDENHMAVAFYIENKIVVFGRNSKYSNSYIFNKSFFGMKLNYDNGAVEETKGYNYSEFLTYNTVLSADPKIQFYAEQLTDGTFSLFGEFSNMDQQQGYFYKLIISPDLSISHADAFSIPYELAINYSKMFVFPNGQTHFVSAVYDSKTFYWYAADGLFNKIREKKTLYPDAYLHLQYRAAQNGTSRSTYIVSTMTGANSSIEMVQAEDKDPGNIQCLGTDTSFVKKVSWKVTEGDMQWRGVKDNEATLNAITLTASPVVVSSEYICKPAIQQDSEIHQMQINGEDTVCFPGSSHTYVASTKSKTPLVQWELDSDQNGSLTRLNDSTISVSFTKPSGRPQRVKLYAFSGSCTVVKDSILVTVFPANNKLPTNYTICDLPIAVHPGSGFKNYVWQDGTTDSVYTITRPGKYTVKLETYCGQTIADSIEIASSLTGIRNNYTTCEKDTVTINVLQGFSTYDWAPDYNLTKLTTGGVKVFPEKDTFYTLKATTSSGCEVIDTIFVKVNKAAVISLGRDTTICQNEGITLNAGSRFTNYKWNTEQSTQKLFIDRPGIYYVSAVDENGCSARDTIRIQGKQCENIIYIPTAFSPNGDGKNDLFKPKVSGILLEYELMVYNRFGEVVFKTNDLNRGWSGTYKGSQQNSEAYVWFCKYKFRNEQQRIKKGNLLLIR